MAKMKGYCVNVHKAKLQSIHNRT